MSGSWREGKNWYDDKSWYDSHSWYDANSWQGSGETAVATFDLVPSALGAWSVARQLRSTYTGPLIRLVRASDSAESDFGSTGGVLDAAAVATFLAATTGKLTTIYDQAGSVNLVQATDANRPAYAAAGLNGFPSGDFDGTAHLMTANALAASFAGSDAPMSNYIVAAPDTITGTRTYWCTARVASANAAFQLTNPNVDDYAWFRRDDAASSTTVACPRYITFPEAVCLFTQFPGTTITGRVGGNILHTVSAAALDKGTTTLDLLAIGANPRTPSNFFDGDLSEFAIWTSDVGATVAQSVSANVRAFYGLKSMGIPPVTALQNLPDETGGDVGEGFTCTGLAYDATLNAGAGGWWAGNDGRNVVGDLTFQPSLVALDLTGATKLASIAAGTIFSMTGSLQGVAVMPDGTIRFAAQADNRIYHVSQAGVDQGGAITVTAPNGVAWDSLRSRLYWIQDGQDIIRRITTAGAEEFTIDTDLSDADHLWYDAVRDWIWVSWGANGSEGWAYGYDCTTGVLKGRYRFLSAMATEGIAYLVDRWYVLSDNYFHTTGNLKNQLQTYVATL